MNPDGTLKLFSVALQIRSGTPSRQGNLWMNMTSDGSVEHDPDIPPPFAVKVANDPI